MPYTPRTPGPYYLDEPTEDEAAGLYRIVIRDIRRAGFVFRFERAGKDCKHALLALNDRATLDRVRAEEDEPEELAA